MYCLVSAFSGSVRMRTKSASVSGSSSTRIGKRPCSSGIRSDGLGDVEGAGGDEQDVVGLHRAVLGRDRRALDDRQQVALHALARDVGAVARALAAGDLVDLVEEDDAGLLDPRRAPRARPAGGRSASRPPRRSSASRASATVTFCRRLRRENRPGSISLRLMPISSTPCGVNISSDGAGAVLDLDLDDARRRARPSAAARAASRASRSRSSGAGAVGSGAGAEAGAVGGVPSVPARRAGGGPVAAAGRAGAPRRARRRSPRRRRAAPRAPWRRRSRSGRGRSTRSRGRRSRPR